MSATNNTKQAAWIAIGNLFSYGFGIVSSMILSRYFDKADYGTYKQVLYVYNTLLMVFTLGLPRAYSYFIPRVPEQQARSLINKITRLFFLLGGVFTICLFVFSNVIADVLHNPDLGEGLRIFAIVPLLMLPTMGLEGVLASFKKTKFMAMYTVVTRMFKLLCVALPVMIWDLGYKEALVGFVISDAVAFALAIYLKKMPTKGFFHEKCHVSTKEILRFSLPLLYASVFGIITTSADQFFISRYYGNEVFAVFSNGSINLPFVGMVMGATSAVLSPIFSRMNHEKVDPQEEIYPLWKRVFERSAKFVYPLIVYCFVFADIVMVVLFSGRYEGSTFYFRVKLIENLFRIIAYGPLLINIGKVKFYSNVQLFGAVSVVLLELLCVYTINSPEAISVTSLICSLGRIFVLLFVVSRIFKVRLYNLFPLKTLIKIILPSLAILYMERLLLINIFSLPALIVFIISFSVYCLLFFIVSIPLKLDYKNELSILKRK